MVSLAIGYFGSYKKKNSCSPIGVHKFTWVNSLNGSSAQVINYGATVTSLKIPGRDGEIRDVIAGFSSLKEYLGCKNHAFGATIGRVCDKIDHGEYRYRGEVVKLTKNDGEHNTDGGFEGFDKVVWSAAVRKNRLILKYTFKDGDEGFRGDLMVFAIFELMPTNMFRVQYKAITNRTTCVNIGTNLFFNLAGYWTGAEELSTHQILVNSLDKVEVTEDGIGTGKLKRFTETKTEGGYREFLARCHMRGERYSLGYDHTYTLPAGPTEYAARITHPGSGRVLEIFTNQPALRLYSNTRLKRRRYPIRRNRRLPISKSGCYHWNEVLCARPQNWPNAPNLATAPKCIVRPIDIYHNCTVYKFSVLN